MTASLKSTLRAWISTVLPGAGRHFLVAKSVAHAAHLDISSLERFTKLKRCNIAFLAVKGQGS